ncbi:forkhead box protein N4-like isoform X2 [Biomphalaria glabrata]|nr:forkhead box protein N4-like isoform X2 [Biomphalaria glabrata]XP_055899102.1 forkhead box protein N4-like isoform X2 [Biomphalaria glabrata]
MDSFSDRTHDPLLFLNADKSDLDAFLMSTSAEMAHMAEEMHANVSDVKMENSLDLDSLEANGQLGDMTWLHNSSLSTLTHLDNDDTSDVANMISVNPQSVLPMQIIQNEKTENLLSSESANSAAMRLHANCSNLLNSPENQIESLQQQEVSQLTCHHVLRQDHPTIRILSVASQASPHNSPGKTQNYLITSSRNSPLKPQTFVLTTANGSLPSGLTITTSPNETNGVQQFLLSSPQKLQTITTDKNGRVLLKSGNNLLSPSQASPVLLGRLQTGVQSQVFQNIHLTLPASANSNNLSDSAAVTSTTNCEERTYPKPVFSYSCLIALALKNSKNGSLPVSEIYNFMCENFPYFKTAPDGWKNSVRHNLSLNKCFAKVDNPKLSQGAKKGCLWALNPAKISKMEDEISKWGKKDPAGLLSSMAYPENLEAIEKGQAGLHYSRKKSPDSSPCTPLRAEPTPRKTDCSDMKSEYSQIKIEKFHHNIRLENCEAQTPVKTDYPPAVQRDYTPMRQDYGSPAPKLASHFKLDNADLNCLEIPVSFNNDALTDLVLQNSTWDDDYENNLDLDLICDSPSSHSHVSSQSPLTVRASPNFVSHSTDFYTSPAIHQLYNTISSSPVQMINPSPSSVRTNLFGVTTPTRRTLYT